MSIPGLEELTVPVAGGDLHVARWRADDGAPVVLALHGITANSRSFHTVAAALAGRATVLAPDLRGRAASAGLAGESSMAQHARDSVEVIRALVPTGRVVVVGHSMGAFVAIALAHHRPELVRHVVLLDGGPALMDALPPDVDVDAVLEVVIGPAMARLSMRWPTLDDYLDHWRPHPALAGVFDAALPYLLHDAVEDDGEWRSSVDIAAVRSDATSQLTGGSPPLRMPVPASFLRAERGMMDDPGGLYPVAVVGPIVREAGIPLTTITDANHYSVVLAPGAVAQLADHMATVLTPG